MFFPTDTGDFPAYYKWEIEGTLLVSTTFTDYAASAVARGSAKKLLEMILMV